MKKYYDAVIVGCGVAGCFAALHLPQEADILMITKADTEDSDSFLADAQKHVHRRYYPNLLW